MVNASRHKISVAGGVEVFGMWFDPGHGYHQDFTQGMAKGNAPESLYAVMSGKRFNGACCFVRQSHCMVECHHPRPCMLPMPRIGLIGIWCHTNRTQDYGNSENTTSQPVKTGDYACGAMEAIYFGDAHWQGNTGAGKTGPWLGVRR
jgi:hypothetical protein